MTTTEAVPTRMTPRDHVARRHPGLLAALRWEVRKLCAQYRARVVLLGALLAPVAIVVILQGQSRPPKDTLFGRFATGNGFALALLVLGFASQWLLPLLTAIVAGDVFASEDQHGTWKTVLTRSTSRGRIFWAKTLTAGGFATLVIALLAVSTIVSSLLIVGHQPLIGLSGQTIPAGTALRLVTESWATMLPPMLGFTCLAILLSVWSRNPAVGIAAPVVLGMVMQLSGPSVASRRSDHSWSPRHSRPGTASSPTPGSPDPSSRACSSAGAGVSSRSGPPSSCSAVATSLEAEHHASHHPRSPHRPGHRRCLRLSRRGRRPWQQRHPRPPRTVAPGHLRQPLRRAGTHPGPRRPHP
ncbi:MAG: ABC transporter permease [Nocardioidaceae bacterium]|nr:ABC transporter permease [Nocardioidaceae bacterium]